MLLAQNGLPASPQFGQRAMQWVVAGRAQSKTRPQDSSLHTHNHTYCMQQGTEARPPSWRADRPGWVGELIRGAPLCPPSRRRVDTGPEQDEGHQDNGLLALPGHPHRHR